MTESEPSADEVIQAYRRRRNRVAPVILGGLAVVLLVVGIFLVVLWLSGGTTIQLPSFLSSPTPTATMTPTATLTPTASPTATISPTPSDTPTPEGPLSYIVQEGDSLFSIAEKFGLGDNGTLLLMAYNNLEDANIFVTQELIIPPPDAELPTPTPLPENLARGQEIIYRVLPGDNLQSIALQFNSTAQAIADRNDIDNPNNIAVGQMLIVPVNLVTPVPTATPTRPTPTATPTP